MISKKTLASLLLTGISVLGCANNNNTVRPLYQEDLQKRPIYLGKWFDLQFYGTPKTEEAIQNFLYQWVMYLPERKETWNSPKKTLELGYGDCDEIAILGSWLAEFLGYPPKVLFVTDTKEGHAITLLEKRTEIGVRYGAIQHGYSLYPIFSSIERIVKAINKIEKRNYSYYAIIDPSSLNKNWDITNQNLTDLKHTQTFYLNPVFLENKNLKTRGYRIGKSIIFLKTTLILPHRRHPRWRHSCTAGFS